VSLSDLNNGENMSSQSTHPNATVIDSDVYSDIFSTSAMRDVWSDRSRVQYYLDFEKAVAITQAYLGVVPREAAEEISLHCNVDEIDFAKLKTATKHIGYPVQLTDGLINTEAIMMALGPKMGRGKAHDRLAAISIAVSQGKGRLIDLLSNDPEIVQILDRPAIERLMEPTNYLGNSGAMVDRVLAGRGH
jgi:adenylosuccinate lyase